MNQLRRALGMATTLLLCVTPALAQRSSAQRAPATSQGTALRIAMPDTSLTVDPALVADEQNVQFASMLYSGLVRLDPSYRVVMDTASRYSLSKDRRTYTFFLRRDARFSNGDPLTAEDFRYSIQRSLTPALKSPSAPTYLLDIQGAYEYVTGKAKQVSGLRALDAHTLRIITRWPIPYFLMELTYPTSYALDKKVLTKQGPIDSTAWYTDPVGSGPYKLKTMGQTRVDLARNKYFAGTRPSIATVTISLSPLPDNGLYQYLSHTVDVASLAQYDRTLLRLSGIRQTRMLSIDGVFMNFHRKPFGQRGVRRALTLALNRPALITQTMKQSATPFTGYVPSGQPGFARHLRTLGYSLRQARSDLKAAGFGDGKRFPTMTLYYPDDPGVAKLASAIATAWHTALHLNVSTQALTLNTLVANVQANKLPLYLFGWSADYPDPHDWLSLQWETSALDNNVRYHNSQFDRVVQTADVSWVAANRMRLYDQAQQLLVDDAAWIPLYTPHRLVYLRSTIQNLSVTGYGIIPRSGSWSQVQRRKVPARPHRAGPAINGKVQRAVRSRVKHASRTVS